MKARLLVCVYYDGTVVSQELPEVEFASFSELDKALQTTWCRIESMITDPSDPSTVLFGIYEKYRERMGLAKNCCFLVVRVMQVLLLDPISSTDYDPSRGRTFDP